MRFALLVLLGALPLIEIALLIKIGGMIGVWWTVAIVIGSAILGTAVLYDQGIAVMRRAHVAIARGEPPFGPMVDGMFLAAAGTLLILPGFITDVLGLLLLIPPLRRLVARGLVSSLLGGANVEFDMRTSEGPRQPGQTYRDDTGARGPVIEGEFERIDERSVDPNRPHKREGGDKDA